MCVFLRAYRVFVISFSLLSFFFFFKLEYILQSVIYRMQVQMEYSHTLSLASRRRWPSQCVMMDV